MIRVACPKCGAKYRLDESLLQGKRRGFAKCQKCGERIEVMTDPDPDAPVASESSSEDALQDTTTRSRKMSSDGAVGSETMTMSQTLADTLELPTDKKYSLAVLQGKASGQIFPITKSRITIGRAGTDILLDDPECSRNHAVLEIRGARVTVSDLGSTNGTFVDGQKIDRADLDKHSEFRIGDHLLMLIVTDRE